MNRGNVELAEGAKRGQYRLCEVAPATVAISWLLGIASQARNDGVRKKDSAQSDASALPRFRRLRTEKNIMKHTVLYSKVIIWVAAVTLAGFTYPAYAGTGSAASSTFGLPSGCSGSGGQVVVLVRGMGFPWTTDDPGYWSSMQAALKNDGFDVWRCDTILPGSGVEYNARALADYISRKMNEKGAAAPQSFDIIAHSFGGLVTRQYLNGGYAHNGKVRYFITLGTPHCGSHLADMLAGTVKYSSIYGPLVMWVADQVWPASREVTERYVIENFNRRATGRQGATSFFLGGDGGDNSSYWFYHLGNGALRTWPFGRLNNLSDGLVTLRSSQGQYQSLSWSGYKENKQVYASYSPRGHEYLYQFSADHGQLREGQCGVQGTVLAILNGSAPEPASPVYNIISMLKLADVEEPLQLVGTAAGFLNQDGLFTHTFPIDTTSKAQFTCYTANADVTLTLITPSGQRIGQGDVLPNVQFTDQWDETGRLKTFVVLDPAPGTWGLEGFGASVVPYGEDYSVDANVRGNLALTGETAYIQTSAAPCVVKARLKAGETPVTGQTVVATVASDLVTPTDVTLYDDGAHSDDASGDGLYANTYAGTTAGFYAASLKANGTFNGQTYQRLTSSEFQIGNPNAALTGGYLDSAVDTDGLPGLDALRVQAAVNVVTGTSYTVSAALIKGDDEIVRTSTRQDNMAVGLNTINLDFSGAEIRTKGISGPYTLSDVRLFDNLDDPPLIIQVNDPGYTTQAYSTGTFVDGLPPADITDFRIINPGTSNLTLAWTAPPDDTGVSAYQVRKSGESLTLANWETATLLTGIPAPTSPGTAQTLDVTGNPQGTPIFFAIRARDAAGNWSHLSASPGIVFQPLADRSAPATGSPASFKGIVTAVFPDLGVMYAERADRAWGMAIALPSGDTYAPGDHIYAAGTLSSADPERTLLLPTISKGDSGICLNPVNLLSRSLGGGALGSWTPGVKNGYGTNNIGLLIRTAGKVTFVDPGGQYFTIWDGSRWGVDVPIKDVDGNNGVRIYAPGMAPSGLKEGDFVTVTGISSCSKSGSDLYPKVLVRSAGDIVRQVW